MKKFFIIALMASTLGACNIASVDAGEEKVFVAKPWFFGSGGVYDTPLTEGTAIKAWSTDAVSFTVTPLQYVIKIDDLMSADGVPLDFNAVVVLQVKDSVQLLKKFGNKWYANNIETEVMSYIRDSVRKRGMNETAIDSTAVAAIDNEVTTRIEQYLIIKKIPVSVVRFTIGKANPPDSVKNQRILTAAAQQQQITNLNLEKAEITRRGSEQKRAEADNAYRIQMNLSPEQFVELQRINSIKEVCKSANCTFVQGIDSFIAK